MLQHVKVGDVLKNQSGTLVTITAIDNDSFFPIGYTVPSGHQYSITIEGKYSLRSPILHPLDIIDPTIYNTDSATAESLTSAEPVNHIKDNTTYNLGHIITLPNGTQLYQSNTGHIQFIPQPGASI